MLKRKAGSGVMQIAAKGRASAVAYVDLFAPSIALVVSPAATRKIRKIADLAGHRLGVTSLRWMRRYWSRTPSRHHAQLTILGDARTPESLRRSIGDDSFPGGVLVAQQQWLRDNANLAQRFVRAMQKATGWIASHSPEEIRLEIDEAERMPDADADREAIRSFQNAMSRDGRIRQTGWKPYGKS